MTLQTIEQAVIEKIARAICQSRSCEGIACCQWPSNFGRSNCPVKMGGYDAAAEAALACVRELHDL